MSHFRQSDRDTEYLLPPSLDDWLPKNHLARFVVDTVEQLDLSAQRRLGDVELLGGPAEAALSGDSYDIPQVPEFHHHTSRV